MIRPVAPYRGKNFAAIHREPVSAISEEKRWLAGRTRERSHGVKT
jgi:hypothetical protein